MIQPILILAILGLAMTHSVEFTVPLKFEE